LTGTEALAKVNKILGETNATSKDQATGAAPAVITRDIAAAMELHPPTASAFIREKIAALLERYAITYSADGGRLEYEITDRVSREPVSFALVLAHNTFARQLQVCKFYPGLGRKPGNRYLSAACLFLLIQHAGQQFQLTADHRIFLQCRAPVFNDFYSRLGDFSFRVTRAIQGDNVEVTSPYQAMRLDTSMIQRTPDLFTMP